jgi:hypothetical protein
MTQHNDDGKKFLNFGTFSRILASKFYLSIGGTIVSNWPVNITQKI